MPGFFSRFGLIVLLLVLTACGARDADGIKAPKEVAATAETFLAALRDGQKAEAARYLIPTAQDELDVQFGPDHVRLAKGPKLTARMIDQQSERVGTDASERVTIVYAGTQDGQWTSATLRLARVQSNDKFQVEYWRIANKPPSLATGQAALDEASAQSRYAGLIFWGVIAIFGLLVIGLLVWAYRNRTRPDAQTDTEDNRPAATTIRD